MGLQRGTQHIAVFPVTSHKKDVAQCRMYRDSYDDPRGTQASTRQDKSTMGGMTPSSLKEQTQEKEPSDATQPIGLID